MKSLHAQMVHHQRRLALEPGHSESQVSFQTTQSGYFSHSHTFSLALHFSDGDGALAGCPE
jgi:hypothetical protein